MEFVFLALQRLGFLVVIFAGSSLLGFACQVQPYKPYKFDPTEYVFVGEVMGYTESVEFDRNRPPYSELLNEESLKRTNGLIVRVSDTVFLPARQSEFEVFVYGMGSGCESLGRNTDRLNNDFPIGTRLIVVAQEAFQIPTNSKDRGTRLEINFPRGVLDTDTSVRPSATSIVEFDFSKFVTKYDSWTSQASRAAFEIRKELLRLERSSEDSKKSRILERLLSLDYKAEVIDLYGLLTKYSPSIVLGERRLVNKLVKDGVKRSYAQAFLECSRGEDRNQEPFYSICPLPPRKNEP